LILISFFAGLFAQNFPIDLKSLFKQNSKTLSPLKGATELQDTLRQISKERTSAAVFVSATLELEPEVAKYYGVPTELTVTGSGFIISTEGYVLTNHHVIDGATSITIVLSSGEEFYAGVVGSDAKTDIALLRFQTNGKTIPTLPLGNSDDVKVGDIVVAIGNPWGLSGSMTMGIVSATGRTSPLLEEDAILKSYIQSDVAINNGNSGGPLLNLKGEVIGINSALLSAGGGWDGISFSIPINIAKRIIEDIADDGKIQRGYLGVLFKPLDKDLAEYYGIKQNEGVLVVEVIKGSPAEKGGIKEGDIILEYNNEAIVNSERLVNQVLATPIGKEVNVTVLRDGKKITLKVKIEVKPEETDKKEDVLINNFGTTKWLGMELGNYEQFMDKIIYDGDGLVVVSVDENSNAYKKGISTGDIIVSINSELIKDLSQLKNYQDTKGKVFILKVYRNGKYDIIAIKG